MTELFVAFAQRDRDAVEFVLEGLKKAGFAVTTGFAGADTPKPIEEMALEVKRSAAFVPLLTGASAGSDEFRDMLRAGLLYEKTLAPARLEQAAETGVFASDASMLAFTTYQNEPERLTDQLEKAVDLYEASDRGEARVSDDGATQYAEAGVANTDPMDVAHLVAALRNKGVTPRKSLTEAANAREPVEVDCLGLPKSSEAMLAHWRLIESNGSARELQRFADDYSDDPYFNALAEEGAQRLKRRKYMRAAYIGLDSVIGMFVAGALFYGLAAFCSGNTCLSPSFAGSGGFATAGVAVNGSGAATPNEQRLARQLANAQRQLQRAGNDVRGLRQQNAALRRELTDAQRAASQAAAREQEARNALARAQQNRGGAQQPAPAPTRPSNAGGDASQLRAAFERERNTAAQLRQQLGGAQQQLNQLQQAVRQRDQQIAQLRSRAPAAGAAAAVATPRPRAPVGGASEGLAGAEILLRFYRDELQRVAGSGRRAVLDSRDLATLQRCVLKYTGAVAKVDGVWGRETTNAFFQINREEAGWIIECLRGRG